MSGEMVMRRGWISYIGTVEGKALRRWENDEGRGAKKVGDGADDRKERWAGWKTRG